MTIKLDEKCNSCGEVTKLYSYNGNFACMNCLSMNRHGIPTKHIEKRIESLYNHKKNDNTKL